MKPILRGDIYWIRLNKGEGSEQDGTRPCLVVSNDKGNECSTTLVVVPITKQVKKFKLLHLDLSGLAPTSNAMFEQIRAVDKVRVESFIRRATAQEMLQANELIKLTLGL